MIEIDIPERHLRLQVPDEELARRRAEVEITGFKPADCKRKVSTFLRAYAALATSAAKGAVRDVTKL